MRVHVKITFRVNMISRILIVLVLAIFCPPCLLTPLPTGEKTSPIEKDNTQISDDVKELESLRTSLTNNANNSDHQETLPLRETSELLPTPMPRIETPQANSRSAIFRHRGITEAKKSYWTEKMPQPNDAYKFVGIQYSPTDLAIYVFNTGDEEGVAVAVEELVREGMMGRTDAINYLQDVKQILSFLRDQCNHQKPIDEFKTRAYPKPELTQRIPNPPREQFISAMELNKRGGLSTPMVTTEHPHETVIASTSEPKIPAHSASTTTRPKSALPTGDSHKEDEEKNEEERAHTFRNGEIKRKSLPPQNSDAFPLHVVYKLAKEMFTKSILRDDPTAEDTLTGLVDFLEMEEGNNRISTEVKEKVLEVVSAALNDSLREYQNFLQMNEIPMFDETGLYQHQSKPGKTASKVPISDILRKFAFEGHDNMLQLASKSNRPKSS